RMATVRAQPRALVPSRPSREDPASVPRTVRTAPNECGRHHASDQRFHVHSRPPESAEKGLWTAEKREVIGSTPIPATGKSPAQAGLLLFRRRGLFAQPSGSRATSVP